MISRFHSLLFAIGFGTLFCLAGMAQNAPVQDTVNDDSISIYNLQLTNQQIQKKLDSLERAQLEKELEGLEKNSKRAEELEKELQLLKTKDSIRISQQLEKIEFLKKTTRGYPVAPFDDTLFTIHLKLGSIPAAQRAQSISERIERMYEDYFFNPDSLRVVASETGYELVYKGNETILTVTESDGLWYNKHPEELAGIYGKKIKDAIKKQKADNSLINWLVRLGKLAAVLVGVFLLVTLIQKLFGLLRRTLIKRREKWFKGINVGSTKVLSGTTQVQLILRALTGIKWLFIILAVYLSLPLLFSLLPGTEYITNTLLQWIISPFSSMFSSILEYLPNIFTIGVVYLITAYIIKGLRYFMHQIEVGQLTLSGFHSDFARPTFNILRFVLYAFMLVIIFPYLPGSGSPAFQGISVFIGVLLSLGSSSAINNVIAGLVITYMRPFRIGDRIKIGDISGDVLEKTMLVIKIKTIKNEEITIPNSTILSNNTLNYSAFSKNAGLVLHTTITIGYDVPWRTVHKLLTDAALATEGVMETPAPFVWQTALNDFHISYQLNVYTEEPSRQGAIYAGLHANIQDAFRDAGIEILSPGYMAWRNGNDTTVPPLK